MSEQAHLRRTAILGTIRHRLLVNALVDPAEAARHLPAGVRPHVTGGGTIVGCCLLAIDHIRPAGLPSALGLPLRAAAHRISVEWDDESGATTVGVYVPVRHTTSLPARAIGGRWFPGVHRSAAIRTTVDGHHLQWTVEPRAAADRYGIQVAASIASSVASEPCEPIGGTCLAATVGLSPDRHGAIEAARMEPERRAAHEVTIDELDSRFLNAFTSIRPTTSYLMRDIQVRWTPARAPRSTAREVAA